MSIQEVEAEIAKLPHAEFWQLMESLDDLKNERWDNEIARDFEAGRFDEAITRGRKDTTEGRGTPI